jgi:hypothetical protein
MDASNRIQSNSGTVTAASSITVSLPNATQPGSTLLLMVATAGTGSVNSPGSQSFDPPWFTELVVSGNVYWWRRDNQPDGETSWALSTIAVSNTYAWHVQEWAGLSTAGNPDARSTIAGTPSFKIIAGQQVNDVNASGEGPVPDVTDYAALLVAQVTGFTDGVWPAGHTWGAGWSEIDSVQSGDGSHTSDFWLLLAEAYPGTSGSALSGALTWDTTSGGAYASKTVRIGAGCYQPSVPAPPTGILTA